MKTTIDIPDQELKEVLKHTGAKTKKDAIVFAVKNFNKKQRLAKIAQILGTFNDFMTQDDLKMMREDEKWNKTK